MKNLIVLFCFVTSHNIFAQYIPTNGLIALYRFHGNANDSSGNNQHMTVNGATLSTDRFGRNNQAYQFDGINDLISYGALLPNSFNLSWSFWVMADGVQNSVVLFNGDGNANGYGFSINSGTNPSVGSPGSNLTFFSGGINYNITTPLSMFNWHHVVLTKDNAEFKLYVDNILLDSSSNSFNVPSGLFHLGLDFTDGSNAFKGSIDEVVVYNKTLSVPEIDTLFHGCGNQIMVHPVSTSLGLGNTAKFFASFQPGVLNYQWQMNAGSGYVNLSNAGPFSGVTTDTLTISNPSPTLHNNSFRVVAINDINCVDTSHGAILNLCSNQIVAQPSSLSVGEGNTVKFIVVALPGVINYQWQMDAGTGFANLSNAGPFSGTNTDTLTISNSTTSLNNNDFRVILTNSASCSDTSIGVKLSVWPTSVDELQDERMRLVYPNPSDGNFMLDLSNWSEGKVRLEIYDVSGRKVVMKDLDHFGSVIAVNTGIEQKGVFFLRLTSEGKTLLRQSIFIR